MPARSEPLLWVQLIGVGAFPLEALLLLLLLAGSDPGPVPALERLLCWALGGLATTVLLWKRPADVWSLLLVQTPLRARRPLQQRLSRLQDALLLRGGLVAGGVLSLPLLWWLDDHAAIATALSPLSGSPRLVVLLLSALLLAVMLWQWQQLLQALWLLSRSAETVAAARPMAAADLEAERLCLGLPLLLLDPLPVAPLPVAPPPVSPPPSASPPPVTGAGGAAASPAGVGVGVAASGAASGGSSDAPPAASAAPLATAPQASAPQPSPQSPAPSDTDGAEPGEPAAASAPGPQIGNAPEAVAGAFPLPSDGTEVVAAAAAEPQGSQVPVDPQQQQDDGGSRPPRSSPEAEASPAMPLPQGSPEAAVAAAAAVLSVEEPSPRDAAQLQDGEPSPPVPAAPAPDQVVPDVEVPEAATEPQSVSASAETAGDAVEAPAAASGGGLAVAVEPEQASEQPEGAQLDQQIG